MFPYGTLSGDLILAEGDDETSRVLSLPKPLYFYDTLFSQLYVSRTQLMLICMIVTDVFMTAQLFGCESVKYFYKVLQVMFAAVESAPQ